MMSSKIAFGGWKEHCDILFLVLPRHVGVVMPIVVGVLMGSLVHVLGHLTVYPLLLQQGGGGGDTIVNENIEMISKRM